MVSDTSCIVCYPLLNEGCVWWWLCVVVGVIVRWWWWWWSGSGFVVVVVVVVKLWGRIKKHKVQNTTTSDSTSLTRNESVAATIILSVAATDLGWKPMTKVSLQHFRNCRGDIFLSLWHGYFGESRQGSQACFWSVAATVIGKKRRCDNQSVGSDALAPFMLIDSAKPNPLCNFRIKLFPQI